MWKYACPRAREFEIQMPPFPIYRENVKNKPPPSFFLYLAYKESKNGSDVHERHERYARRIQNEEISADPSSSSECVIELLALPHLKCYSWTKLFTLGFLFPFFFPYFRAKVLWELETVTKCPIPLSLLSSFHPLYSLPMNEAFPYEILSKSQQHFLKS